MLTKSLDTVETSMNRDGPSTYADVHGDLDQIYTGLVTTVQVLYLLEIFCLG